MQAAAAPVYLPSLFLVLLVVGCLSLVARSLLCPLASAPSPIVIERQRLKMKFDVTRDVTRSLLCLLLYVGLVVPMCRSLL